MNAYSNGLYEKAMPASMTWREKLECAKECGYDFVEISIDEKDEKLARLDWTAAERVELAALMKEVGVPIRSMCLSGHRKYPLGASDPTVRARSMEIMEKAIQLADDLGIRIIQLAGYDVYYEESTPATKAAFAENLRKAVDMAAEKGVTLGFETMETDFMNTTWKSMNLEEAKVIVTGGRGMGSQENFALVEELAQLLGGVVGATRPAIEEGWVSRAHQVGQSGKIVSPALYIACGVSGATQHVSGMTGSGYVVAINKDEDAPIFDVADVGIVGDVMKVLPAMIEEIRKRKAE